LFLSFFYVTTKKNGGDGDGPSFRNVWNIVYSTALRQDMDSSAAGRGPFSFRAWALFKTTRIFFYVHEFDYIKCTVCTVACELVKWSFLSLLKGTLDAVADK